MLIDLTLKITPEMAKEAQKREHTALAGHVGTHFDIMDQEFPLSYTRRKGIVFDVSSVRDRDIGIDDIAGHYIEAGMFVAFYTGFLEKNGYGSKGYFSTHPQLTHELIDLLLEKRVSIIGIDFAGVRRGSEHPPKDQYCAERGTFIIENLCGLKSVLSCGSHFTAHTYPMTYTHVTGLPCRVIAEL